jgi:hypothetical protein
MINSWKANQNKPITVLLCLVKFKKNEYKDLNVIILHNANVNYIKLDAPSNGN